MRGKVKEYTTEVENRLTKRLKRFLDESADKRMVMVTLTTVENDPSLAKRLRIRWVASVRRRYNVHGIYVMEFNERGQVHYHFLLAISGTLALKPTSVVRETFWQIWKKLGPHVATAFKVRPANFKEPCRLIDDMAKSDAHPWSAIIHYLAKSDVEPKIPHPKRWQKTVPEPFKARGPGCHFWGVVGSELSLGSQPNGLHDDDSDDLPWNDEECAA